MIHTFIIRHAEYNESTGDLTQNGALKSKIKGEEIREAIGTISSKQIAILSSTAPRALETTQNIIEGLGTRNSKVIEVPELWSDNQHKGNVNTLLKVIKQLPSHMVLIIITHMNFNHEVAQALGHESSGYIDNLGTLEFDDSKEEIRRSLAVLDGGVDIFDNILKTEISDEDLKHPLRIEVKIPLGNLRVIEILPIIGNLQGFEGKKFGGNFGDNGQQVSFIVPKIIPQNPEESMIGEHDKAGFLPVVIETNGEEITESKDSYKQLNQLNGIQQVLLSTYGINPNEWEITKVSKIEK